MTLAENQASGRTSARRASLARILARASGFLADETDPIYSIYLLEEVQEAITYGVCYGVAILYADFFNSPVAVLHANYQ